MSGAPSAPIERAAERLLTAARSRTPCPPVRDILPDASAQTAYAVQTLLTREALRNGRRVVGRKIGLTSVAVQQQLGVDQPDFGVLFDDMVVPAGTVIDIGTLLQPKIEAELAFVLGADLDHDDLGAQALRAAIDHVVPALEIVDSRIAGWDITFADTVGDNASSGLFVLGDTPTKLGELDLRPLEMTLVDDTGATLSRGSGAACLGDPLEAVRWLARTCRDLGSPLRAGETALSGALGCWCPSWRAPSTPRR